MSEQKKVPTFITNIDEYNKLVSQFYELCHQLENFEFKFYSDENPNPVLVVKDISLPLLKQGSH